jgi:RNA-directed DNA polymerase
LHFQVAAEGFWHFPRKHEFKQTGRPPPSKLFIESHDARLCPVHPQTQGKIERWHQTLKNRILLDNYYLPGNLERQIGAFVEHDNHYHESIDNLTPADVYFGRAKTILTERQRIKRETIANHRLQHRLRAA